MAKLGILINYDFCTGCQTCAVACQQEHDHPVGKSGIKITEYVYEGLKKPVAIDFLPFITEICDLCVNRCKTGDDPACVRHCQSFCMKFGPLDELVKDMELKGRFVLYTPR